MKNKRTRPLSGELGELARLRRIDRDGQRDSFRALVGHKSVRDTRSGGPATAAWLVCVVEIPKGGRNKYEYDPELGGVKFDRLLMSAATLRSSASCAHWRCLLAQRPRAPQTPPQSPGISVGRCAYFAPNAGRCIVMLLRSPRVEVGSRISFSVESREGTVIDVPWDGQVGSGVPPGYVRVELDDGSRVDVPDDAIIGRRESVVDGWPRVENALRALPNGASEQ